MTKNEQERFIDKLIYNDINFDDGKHTRKVGRYNASDVSSIEKGYLTVMNFFEKKPFELSACRRIISGKMFETGFEALLDRAKVERTYNPKYEIQLDKDIVICVDDHKSVDDQGNLLVCKPDWIMPNYVLEAKMSGDNKDWDYLWEAYQYQLECEWRVTQKPVYLYRFKFVNGNEFYPQAREYFQNDLRWEKIKEILRKFDSSLKIYLQKYGSNEQNNSGVEGTTENKL